MSAGIVFIALVGLVGLAWIVAPMTRRDALEPDDVHGTSLDELRELHARQQMLLASLKDLEDDRATDKLGDDDYERLKAELSTQAIDVMKQLDAAEQDHEHERERVREATRPLQYPGGRQPGKPS